MTIFHDLSDLSQIEEGDVVLQEQEFDLRLCIEGALQRLLPAVTMPSLEIFYELEEKVPCFLIGDSVRLQQILLNVIGNSLKFTKRGEVFISVSHVVENEDAVELLFSIKDTGIGLSEDEVFELFDDLSFLTPPTEEERKSNGLYISAKLLELMAGSIWVDSELGMGSTFFFSLMLKKSDRPSNLDENIFKTPEHAYQVFLLSSHIPAQKILKKLLAFWGIQVQTSSNLGEILSWSEVEDNHFHWGLIDPTFSQEKEILAQIQKNLEQKNSFSFLPLLNPNTTPTFSSELNIGFQIQKPIFYHALLQGFQQLIKKR